MAKRNPKKLTPKSKKFCRLLVEGEATQSEAYRQAFGLPEPTTPLQKKNLKEYASSLKHCKLAQEYIKSLEQVPEDEVRLSKAAKLKMLSMKIIEAYEKGDTAAFVALMKQHNEMTGDNAPTKAHTTVDVLSTLVTKHKDLLEE